jgi:hypothetical protein
MGVATSRRQKNPRRDSSSPSPRLERAAGVNDQSIAWDRWATVMAKREHYRRKTPASFSETIDACIVPNIGPVTTSLAEAKRIHMSCCSDLEHENQLVLRKDHPAHSSPSTQLARGRLLLSVIDFQASRSSDLGQ